MYKVVELESTKGDLVEVDNPDEINASSGTTTPPTNCTVTNSFGAKEIDVEKFWVDSDNCDGLRPEAINIVIEETVTEKNKPTNININKTLENSEGWRKRVVLPKYYYNGGTRVEGLTFSISELLSGTAAEHEYNIKKNGYSEDYVSGYKLHDEETIDFPHHSDKVAISENNKDLEALYLRNTKQRIKGEITVRKNWLSNLDDASHWNTRPESIYIKLMRRLDE